MRPDARGGRRGLVPVRRGRDVRSAGGRGLDVHPLHETVAERVHVDDVALGQQVARRRTDELVDVTATRPSARVAKAVGVTRGSISANWRVQ